ncbi:MULTISPECIES: ferrous iron transport protein B [unclassified Faecalibacillus]|uniref:ferrous iron transport protein B n=1 Tax=unclassified Faecalibacillus TaxID=2678890 RepID=UPI001D0AFEC2|nr:MULTISPECIES: ferrous iron transport protein B [unclassified Faecalibacillus]MCB8539967.1 ferrous iron transport protein B [Faecalibacillus sp. TM498]MCB8557732.1 ferrous iron transport protein B [Faecalibacillus sp. TM111]
MKLDNLAIGKSAVIISVGGTGALRQHFLDMGLIQGVEVTVVKYAPMGDPIEIKIHDYELTLRKEDAQKIEVKEITKKEELKNENIILKNKNHPGYGESSYDKINNHQIYHESDLLTFALVGNQNCGKTTLFNQLTGSNQHVGNFPGVTVDRKDGVIKGYKNTLITDLPGIYSMSPYSSEEIVTRNFLLKEKPKAIINIVDATNIERNLYLTMQLLELNMPMVVALNMMDEMSGNGGTVLINELEAHLGVPVVPISAAKGEGIDELVSHVLHVAYYQEKPQFLQHFDNQALDRCINAIEHLIEDHAKKARIPLRFAASKLAENDSLLLEQLDLSQNEKEILEHIRKQLEEESSFDCSAAIASDRFHSIINICRQTVKKPHESKERLRSQKIDQFLTGKYTGIPAFIGIMGIVFFLTFNVIGSFLQGILENGVSIVTNYVDTLLTQAQINVALHSLIIDGIFNGVGTVLSFLPIIVTLFFFLSILEDSGYMARVAFIMDKLLRKIGLSGRSIVPMLIGFGCTVPGVMASRTLSSRRDRQMTIILTPFMSCSAKLPIYAFFTSVFFPGKGALVMIFLYVFGILTGIIFALILKGSLFKGEPVPFVMELPNYRMPGAKNVCQLLWEKAKDFLQRAFTVIFVATIVIWFLQTFDLRFNIVTESKDSILAILAGYIAPIFNPLGFGDWRISTALISGFMAKESVVSTLSILYGSTQSLLMSLTTPAALSLLIFCLLYTPCIAAIAAIKRELNGKWALIVVFGQCLIAWLASFVVYHLILLVF